MSIGLGLAIGIAGAAAIARMLASVLFGSGGIDVALGASALGARNSGGGSQRPGSLSEIAREFPALRQQVNGQPLIYLDSAATTLRPQAVIDALVEYLLNR